MCIKGWRREKWKQQGDLEEMTGQSRFAGRWGLQEEMQFSTQIGALREMQTLSGTNSSATSLSDIEGRTKACIPSFRDATLLFKRKKGKNNTQQELGAGCMSYQLFVFSFTKPWWSNESFFVFFSISGTVLICCYSRGHLHLKTRWLSFLLESKLSASLSMIQFTDPKWTNNNQSLEQPLCIVAVLHFSLSSMAWGLQLGNGL